MCRRSRNRKSKKFLNSSSLNSKSSSAEKTKTEDQEIKIADKPEVPIQQPKIVSLKTDMLNSEDVLTQNAPKQIELTAAERAQPNWNDADEDFDAICEVPDEEEIGNVKQEHGSVLKHLLKQVRPGMDLTKISLPTFILERRSLLEMYADFFAHPDDFVRANDLEDAESRFIAVVRYYLAAFYPARKSGVAKKPYNPILGETFRCRWTLPDQKLSGEKTKAGPFPGSDANQVTFVAEQVSHHPPISAFYAEHPAKRISLSAQIWTKSSFHGFSMSIGVTNVGVATLSLHEHAENYVCNFPSGYGRSILGKPWIELGGKVEVRCEESGYFAEIEFLTKPTFGGNLHKIVGSVYKSNNRKAIMTLKGEWNGVIYAKESGGSEYVFLDVKSKPEVKKECDPIARQGDRESRRLWRHVTAALYRNRIDVATEAKKWIEQRQREETRDRTSEKESYQPVYFRKTADSEAQWTFKDDLGKRGNSALKSADPDGIAKPSAQPNNFDHPNDKKQKTVGMLNENVDFAPREAKEETAEIKNLPDPLDLPNDSFSAHQPVHRQALRSAEVVNQPPVARNRADYKTLPTSQTNPFSTDDL